MQEQTNLDMNREAVISDDALPEGAPDNLFDDADALEDGGASGLPDRDALSETSENAETVRVKYNGQEQEIPLADAAALIQKGMNYDHVRQELEGFRNDDAFRELEQMAKESGMSKQELLKASVDPVFRLASQADRRVQALEEQLSRHSRAVRENERYEEFLRFFKENPGTDPSCITPEMLRAGENGQSMTQVYLRQQNEALMAQLGHQRSRDRGVGTVTGQAPAAADDGFLEAFMKD